jgi:hypothetical protein
MPASMVALVRPPPMVQRKPLSYRTYKEGSNPDAYMRYFEKCIWHDGETDEVVIINLFGTTLTDKVQRWYDDWLDYHQYCTWKEAKEAFKLMYREQDCDEQVYTALRTFKQGESEKVQDYYERFMKLMKCLQSDVGEGFKLTYFRTGLLDYLRITTSGNTVETLNELKEVTRRCENNYIDALGRKLILHMKKIETAPSKAVAMSTKVEGSEVANKRFLLL